MKTPADRLALKAYDRILELIMSGEAAPGSMVNERWLGDQLGMSRSPVRDALLVLETERLLVRKGGRGLQVRQIRVEDFIDALQVRLLLEPEAARIAAERISVDDLGSIEERLDSILAKVDSDDLGRDELRSIDNALHELIGEAAGNEQMAAIIRSLRLQTQIFDLKTVPERLKATCQEHLKIAKALRARKGVAAGAAMSLHLERIRESIVDHLMQR